MFMTLCTYTSTDIDMHRFIHIYIYMFRTTYITTNASDKVLARVLLPTLEPQ